MKPALLALLVALTGPSCGKGAPEAPRQDETPATATAPAAAPEPQPADPTPAEPAPAEATPAAAAGTLRVVVVHGGELLGSEARAVRELQARLLRDRQDGAAVVEASGEEAAAARAVLAGGAAALHPGWREVETVVILEVRPPRGAKKGSRTTGGVGGVAILRPPAAEPVYREEVIGEAAFGLRGEEIATWLGELTALAGAAGE